MSHDELKNFYHGAGFNIVEFAVNKVPIGPDVAGKPVCAPHRDIAPKELETARWGIRMCSDRPQNYIFFDWDHGEMPADLEVAVSTHRRKHAGTDKEQYSYHGVICVEDADGQWCGKFVTTHGVDGLELFHKTRNLVLVGEYMDDTKNPDSSVSTWEWVGEKREIISLTKADLEKLIPVNGSANGAERDTVPAKNGAKNAGLYTVSAGLGRRHNALISETWGIAKKLGKDADFESVYGKIIASGKIEGIEEYRLEGAKYAELKDIIDWVLSLKDDNSKFGYDLIKSRFRLARLKYIGEANQFNTWAFKDNRWDSDIGAIIQEYLKKVLGDNAHFRITAEYAVSLGKELGGDVDALKVDLEDDEYRKAREGMFIATDGRYYDLETGEIKELDINSPFFKRPDGRFGLVDDAEDPAVFIEFLNTRFGTSWEMVRDHLASMFLPPRMLPDRPKALVLVGDKRTWKTFVGDLMRELLDTQATSQVTLIQLEKDQFAEALLRNKLFNISTEESVSIMKDPALFKELVTAKVGLVRVMHSDVQESVHRYPRWLICTNKLAPIPKNDLDSSIFDRLMYIETQPLSKDEKNWRDHITKKEERAIVMYLLRRAHEIYSTKAIISQDWEKAQSEHARLTSGSLADFLGLTEKSMPVSNFRRCGESHGVSFMDVLQDYKKWSGSNTSPAKLTSMLQELKLEKSKERCQLSEEGRVTYEVVSTGSQKVLILGIMQIRPPDSQENPAESPGQ